MATSSTFIRYCKALASKGSASAPAAQACIHVGGRDPGTCRQKLATALSNGLIDRDSYDYRLEAVNAVADMYATRDRICESLGVEDTGWDTLGEGSWVRRDIVYDSRLL